MIRLFTCLLLFSLAATAQAQERLEWELSPGTRYALDWTFSREESDAVRAYDWTCSSGLSLASESLTEMSCEVELGLALVAPLQSDVPVLSGRVERLRVTIRRNGLRLAVAPGGGDAIEPVRGFKYGTPAEEAHDRAALEGLRDALRQDVHDGLTLEFPPGERPRLRGEAQPVWDACWVQPAVPQPLARGAEWGVPLTERPFGLQHTLPDAGPRPALDYGVTSLSGKRAVLGYRWRHRIDETTGDPTFKQLLRGQEQANAKIVFDRKARHVARAEWTSEVQHQAIDVVNGVKLGDGDEFTARWSSVVEVRQAAPGS